MNKSYHCSLLLEKDTQIDTPFVLSNNGKERLYCVDNDCTIPSSDTSSSSNNNNNFTKEEKRLNIQTYNSNDNQMKHCKVSEQMEKKEQFFITFLPLFYNTNETEQAKMNGKTVTTTKDNTIGVISLPVTTINFKMTKNY